MGNSRTRAAAVIWFAGAAVVGAVAAGLHLLRSQIGGAHQGLSLTLSAFGLTALAAVMLFHGVVLAAQAQDAVAEPDPIDGDDSLDDLDESDDLGDLEEPARTTGEPAPVLDEPERDDAEVREADTAYHSSTPEATTPDGPDVYTFRRGKAVREPSPRVDRPPPRDRPA